MMPADAIAENWESIGMMTFPWIFLLKHMLKPPFTSGFSMAMLNNNTDFQIEIWDQSA